LTKLNETLDMTKNEAAVMWDAAMRSDRFSAMVEFYTAEYSPKSRVEVEVARAGVLRAMADAFDPVVGVPLSSVAPTATGDRI
jgi:hypothetical protein